MHKKLDTEQKKKDLIIAIIGIGLIIIVAIVTIGRQFIEKNNITKNKEKESTVNIPSISTQELKDKILHQEKIHIIDIRNKDLYEAEHIPSSENFPLDNLKDARLNFPLNEPVVIVGYETSSEENASAIEILNSKGYKDVSVIIGGINAWSMNSGATVSVGDPSSFVDQSKVVYIKVEQVKDFIEKNPRSIFIIDVRSEQEFKKEHLPFARNIPLDSLELSKKDIPFSKKLIVYGNNELQGFQAGVRLYDLGFFNAQVLQKGFSDWKDKGFSLEK